MSIYTFAISLNSAVRVNATDSGYTLSTSPTANADWHTRQNKAVLTFPATAGMGDIFTQLQEGGTTVDKLVQNLTHRDINEANEELAAILQQLEEQGWLNYAVFPLAIAMPMVATAQLNLNSPHWTNSETSLSRFAYQHTHEGVMMLESPLSKYRVKLLDWKASAILSQLAQPRSLKQLTALPQMGAETVYQFLNLLWATGFLDLKSESSALRLWDFHNLLFHSRSRQGRHDHITVNIDSNLDI